MLPNLSTSTPASDISKADFERDDQGRSDESALPSFDDILKNSPMAEVLGLGKEKGSLPTEDEDVTAPEESDGEEVDVPETTEDAEDDSDEEGDQEADNEESTDEDEEDSTQDAELPSEDDIDWEYKVPVKIDGKTVHVTLEEIRKGYATDKHLSQKGRELGEERKKIEVERNTKLGEIATVGQVVLNELLASENALQNHYNTLSEKIQEARDSGDTYTARDLKDQQEQVQAQYWETRNRREQGTAAIVQQIQNKQKEEREAMAQNFIKEIPGKIPDWSPKVAKSIREFALAEGIPAELLNIVYDANVVKFINDYRKLKIAKESGVQKRKVAPKVKGVPTKKGTSQEARAKTRQNSNRTKVLSGEGTADEQNEFLKNLSGIRERL